MPKTNIVANKKFLLDSESESELDSDSITNIKGKPKKKNPKKKPSGSKRITPKKQSAKKSIKIKGRRAQTTDECENEYATEKDEILKMLKKINDLTKKTVARLKNLERIHKKEIRQIKKNTRKTSGKCSGIVKPAPVPKPLQKLLGLDDKPRSRSDVSKLVYKYIEQKKLFSPKTRKIIIPNKELKNVFGIKNNEVIKFENFQTWLKKVYNETDDLVLDIND